MVYYYWRIERYARISDGVWDTNPEVITNAFDISVVLSLGESSDTFSFKQYNLNGSLSDYWQIGDKVLIYKAKNTTTITSNDLIINGIVNDVPVSNIGGVQVISVKGTNFSSILTRALAFYTPASPIPINEWLQGVVNSVAIHNRNFQVTWNSSNPTTKTNGDSFPLIDEKWFYKSVIKALNKYSSKVTTEDVNYYWYVDVNNELVWKPATKSVNNTFNSSTDNYSSLKIGNDLKGVVNFVVSKGGVSPSNKPITVRNSDPVSISKNGQRYYLLISEVNTARKLMELDGVKNNYPSSYPFTTSFGVTVNNDEDYDTAIINEVKARLKDEAQAFINERRYGKLVVNIDFIDSKGWSVGDVISVTIADINKVNNLMRVARVSYNDRGESYSLIEDEGTVGK